MTAAIFFAKTKMGWTERVVNKHAKKAASGSWPAVALIIILDGLRVCRRVLERPKRVVLRFARGSLHSDHGLP
jgi:hypothetical protein